MENSLQLELGSRWFDNVLRSDWKFWKHSESLLSDISTFLIRNCIETYCIKNGLEKRGRYLYFPNNLLPNNRLNFTRYDGRRTYVKSVSERKFRYTLWGVRHEEILRYHLSPNFHIFKNLLGDPVIRLRIRVFWTDINGYSIEAKKANRRRKSLCKDWWNYQWLSRILAILHWMGNGDDEICILNTKEGKLRIGLKPFTYNLSVGIDETLLGRLEPEDESSVVEDTMEDDDYDTI